MDDAAPTVRASQLMLSGGVSKVVSREGSGPTAVQGDHVALHYVARVARGAVFDESRSRGSPLSLVIGSPMVVDGV